jgi:hypothetical protein
MGVFAAIMPDLAGIARIEHPELFEVEQRQIDDVFRIRGDALRTSHPVRPPT